MRAYLKDAFRTIRQNGKRLGAVMTMVVLGVGLFVGIPMACDNAYLSAGDFYNSVGMFDIRIVSTLGLTGDDVAAISSVEGIDGVFACFSKNVRTDVRDKDIKVSVTVIDDGGMNTPHLLSGKLPESGREIAVSRDYLRASGKKIGDPLFLTERTGEAALEAEVDDEDGGDEFDMTVEEEKKNNLLYDEYLITAMVLSPMDTSVAFSDNTGGSAYLFYVGKDGVSSEVYTEVFATVSGASKLNCYGAAYNNLVKGVIDSIDDSIKEGRLQARHSQIKNEALERISDAETKLAEKRAEADEELSDGEQKLIEAREKISDGEKEIADGWRKVGDNSRKLAEAAAKIADSEAELAHALEKLQEGRAEYEEGLAIYNSEIGKLNSLQQGISAMPGMISMLGAMLPAPQDVQLFSSLAGNVMQSAGGGAALLAMGDEQSKAAALMIESLIAGASQALAAGQWQDAANLLSQVTAFQSGMETAVQTARQRALAEGAKLVQARVLLEEGFAAYYEGSLKLEEGRAEIEDGRRQLYEAGLELEDASREIEEAKTELEEKEVEFYDGVREYEEKIADADLKIKDAKAEIGDLAYPKWYILGRSSVDSFERLKNDVSSIRAVGSAFPVIFLIVAVSVCLTSMTRLVEEERSIVGAYMALGYSSGMITMKYVIFALIACILGGLVGALLGFFFFPWAIWQIITMLHEFPVRSLSLNTGYAALGVLIYVIALTAATVWACRREMQRKPSELMRPKPPKSGGRILLERVSPLWERLKFLSKVTARNLFRYKKRMFMTIFGVTGCTALIVTGFALKNSALDLVNAQFDTVTLYDMIAVFDSEKDGAASTVSGLLNDGAAEDFTPVRINSITLLNSERESLGIQIIATGLAEEFESYVKLTDEFTKKRIDMPDRGVVITENAAKVLGIKTGDTVAIQDSDNAEHEATVTAIAHNYLGNYIYCSMDFYGGLMGDESPNAYFIKLSDSLDETERAGFRRTLSDEKVVLSVTNIDNMRRSFTNSMSAVDSVVYILIIMAACLAFVVLYTLANINISERRRELATIKVLGFYDREVFVYVNRETVMLAVAGIVLGLPAGRGIGEFIVSTIRMPSISIHIAILPVSYAAAAFLTLTFTLIINIFTNRSLRRLDMIESLKSAE